jgi:hypothetical protein
MKISVNNQDLFELNDIQKQVIMNQISDDIFEEDMKRRLQWVLMHKYEECFKELKSEWDQKLPQLGITSVPTNPDEYAQLIFSQKEYKNRKQRDASIEELI